MAHTGKAGRRKHTPTQSADYKQNRKRTSSRKWIGLLAGVALGTVATQRNAHAQYAGQLSSIVMDANTGAVLSQTDPDLRRYPASLTKLMTLYLTFSALRAGTITLDQLVPVSIHAATMEPSKLGVVPGSRLTVQQAILALVTKSANDAACALGEFLGGGSEPQFAALMTQQARALGMSRTTFRNASGLPDPDQLTTARDLATLGRHLINDFPEDYHYFSTAAFRFHGRMIPNHNPMLKAYVGADGMKTGYTEEAGRNLVTSALRSNVRLVGVVMGASSNGQRTLAMADQLDRGFDAEGVAPVERPLVLARNIVPAHHHAGRVIVLAAASTHAHAPLEVAEAPVGRRGVHHVRATPVANGHHLRLIGAKVHPATASTSKHTLHKAHATRSRT
ncbi:D-alanyl-D-alanine carboxypeptidase family protein [Acetobacter sp.]|uniref:D-alanyl-D-alanine carboxypeptidase family protein n=1 Tax=Acetobacter sp. TaxID=440 RepID=UPI0039EC33AF